MSISDGVSGRQRQKEDEEPRNSRVERGSVRLNWKASLREAVFICTHMAICELHSGGGNYISGEANTVLRLLLLFLFLGGNVFVCFVFEA